jgi:hypothetical protein
MRPLEALIVEYKASPTCPYCDGEDGLHKPIQRSDGRTIRCSGGDVVAIIDQLEDLVTAAVTYGHAASLYGAAWERWKHGFPDEWDSPTLNKGPGWTASGASAAVKVLTEVRDQLTLAARRYFDGAEREMEPPKEEKP